VTAEVPSLLCCSDWCFIGSLCHRCDLIFLPLKFEMKGHAVRFTVILWCHLFYLYRYAKFFSLTCCQDFQCFHISISFTQCIALSVLISWATRRFNFRFFHWHAIFFYVLLLSMYFRPNPIPSGIMLTIPTVSFINLAKSNHMLIIIKSNYNL